VATAVNRSARLIDLGCRDSGLDAEAVQVLEIVVGHEPGMAAGRGVGRGADLKIPRCPCHHAILAVRRLVGPHADEPGMPQVLIIVCGVDTLIDRDRGDSKDCSWQTPSLTTRHVSNSGLCLNVKTRQQYSR
jgi:hypothetical protein